MKKLPQPQMGGVSRAGTDLKNKGSPFRRACSSIPSPHPGEKVVSGPARGLETVTTC